MPTFALCARDPARPLGRKQVRLWMNRFISWHFQNMCHTSTLICFPHGNTVGFIKAIVNKKDVPQLHSLILRHMLCARTIPCFISYKSVFSSLRQRDALLQLGLLSNCWCPYYRVQPPSNECRNTYGVLIAIAKENRFVFS